MATSGITHPSLSFLRSFSPLLSTLTCPSKKKHITLPHPVIFTQHHVLFPFSFCVFLTELGTHCCTHSFKHTLILSLSNVCTPSPLLSLSRTRACTKARARGLTHSIKQC